MISGNFRNCKNIIEFCQAIGNLQKAAHGENYLDVHDEIIDCLEHNYSYRELGVNQGATLATALLTQPKIVRAYDIKLSNFEPYRELFETFAKDMHIDFKAEQRSSLDAATLGNVDVLYIDTLHTGDHLRKELDYHADTVNKYIICHDTFAKPDMHKAAEKFCLNNPHWKIIKYHRVNVGYTTLERML